MIPAIICCRLLGKLQLVLIAVVYDLLYHFLRLLIYRRHSFGRNY